jgi:endonuclease/exonuclease/phosphatase family metal-dependent hydrolase
MIDRIEKILRTVRRSLSRSEWAIALLGLSRSEDNGNGRGLVMIQIDGLRHDLLKDAIDNGNMPFLRHLVEDERYQLHDLYSGVPSTTPSVQGELFYGVKGAVPAFSYVDRETGQVVRMYEQAPAKKIEDELQHAEGLLDEGSSYCNIYTGGATDSRFCAASGTVSDLYRTTHPGAIPLLAIAHFASLLRMAFLVPLELFLAMGDFAKGALQGQDLWTEFKFVPTRAAIVILLREMITVAAMVDVTRGLPVVHLNFLGYDEQAHRRGPGSLFALWSLKGIDRSIARITRSARRSVDRDYDIWVFSDHGQEETNSYTELFGRSAQDAVVEILAKHDIESRLPMEPRHGIQRQRIRLFGETVALRLLPGASEGLGTVESGTYGVTAMGPLGHVYLPESIDLVRKKTIAQDLVQDANIPLVFIPIEKDKALAVGLNETFELPRDSESVLGEDHPYLETTAVDLVSLCHHPNAGDLIISGWQIGEKSISFPHENGAHGGPGSRETSAFALTPEEIQFDVSDAGPLRPVHLRKAAFQVLGRSKETTDEAAYTEPAEDVLRVMTYNVHSCIGMDGKLSPERIARVITRFQPDIVALQELDMGRERTDGVDQAHVIGETLEMMVHFHASVHVEEEKYGDAVLSRHPMKLVKAKELPRLPMWPGLEPRGAIWVDVERNGEPIHFLNTHLSLHPWERLLQSNALVGSDWLGSDECTGQRILCGDFNATPRSPTCKKISNVLRDSQMEKTGHRPRGTFFSRYPISRIDHVYAEPELEPLFVDVPSTHLTRVASDHLPLIVDFKLNGQTNE